MTTEKPKSISSVVIAGGGTAGWIAASAMAKLLGDVVDISLVESEAIGTVGVGEATIPQILRLNAILGIDEREFIRQTHATFKLGIEFSNWGRQGESYLHTFGDVGINLTGVDFHHYWLRAKLAGRSSAQGYWDHSLHRKAADKTRFAQLPRVGNTSMGGLHYAYHFDATAYAAFLRRYAEDKGVTRVEGRIGEVTQTECGNVRSLLMDDGREIEGDLFIDCTGFRSLLLGQTLGVPYLDWSHLLPCNSAVTVGCRRSEPLLPYTRATARDAGWQWRIPLQHRTGNGYVFSDRYTDAKTAEDTLVASLDADMIGQPRHLKFTTGRRKTLWEKNVISLGLASGFLEPLESTSIHFIQSNVGKIIDLFPRGNSWDSLRNRYNAHVISEFDGVRDFLILHYKLTQRNDTPFWRDCAALDIPDSLAETMELFRETAKIDIKPEDLFRAESWTQVMLGQNLQPEDYDIRADALSEAQLDEFLENIRGLVAQTVAPLPTHSDFVASI